MIDNIENRIFGRSGTFSKRSVLETRDIEGAFHPKMLIVDDDPVVTSVLAQNFKVIFPGAVVSTTNEPIIEPGYDVYFLDNDFDGSLMAKSLIKSVREIEPEALVVALSATLDFDTLRILINCGCNAVYDKRSLEASVEARRIVRNYVAALKERHDSKLDSGFGGIVRSMRGLLFEWNRRLDVQLQDAGN